MGETSITGLLLAWEVQGCLCRKGVLSGLGDRIIAQHPPFLS